MLRFGLIIAALGGFLGYQGYKEFTLLQKANEEPSEVALVDIEADGELENYHVKIGTHWGVVDELIYQYPENNESKVDVAYYPIISEEHPYNQAIDVFLAKFENTPAEQIPDDAYFKVLVKTKAFKSTSDFPDHWIQGTEIQGLMINAVEPLGSEERNLLRQAFPAVNFDEILILEQDREPSSPLVAFGMLGGGVVVVLLGLGLIFGKFFGSSSEPQTLDEAQRA